MNTFAESILTPGTQVWWKAVAAGQQAKPKEPVCAGEVVQQILSRVKVKPPEVGRASPRAVTSKRIVPEFERELMTDLRELLGPAEMASNGGMWRTLIKGNAAHPANPGKVRRVLETIRSEKREGKKIKTTLGCYAMHLFQTFA